MKTVLETGLGPVCGFTEEGNRIFRGLPYAITERFQAPVRIDSLAPFAGPDGIFDASGPETDCFQLSAFRDEAGNDPVGAFYHREFRSEGREYRFAESPMQLSIVTPEDARDLPVLLFIHGGGFETGCVGELPYVNCSEYAKRGIIFVSVGYRLNVFSLYECGNYGLQDLVCAVEWVRLHIADFGGDGSRITLIGQSAGAMCITDLLMTKRLEGLIRGAVCMSGGGALPRFAAPLPKEKAAPFWEAVRRECGCTKEEAHTVPAERLWEAWYKVSRSRKSGLRALTPGVDGSVIPGPAQDQEKKKLDLPVPLIIGVCSQDMMPSIVYEVALKRGKRADRDGYPPVWGYFFDRTLPGNSYKAFHAADLWYLFGHMDLSWRPFEETDYALSAQMIDHVAQFVKTGDPNGEALPAWPALSKKQKAFRRFDGEAGSPAMIGSAECRRKTLRSFTVDRGPM